MFSSCVARDRVNRTCSIPEKTRFCRRTECAELERLAKSGIAMHRKTDDKSRMQPEQRLARC